MPGIESKLPDGWERSETTSGIPYYINHETERTQWDHPEMVKLLQDISGLSNIKYAAYRTAMKLRAIQKKSQLYLVELPILTATLDEEDIRDGYTEKTLSAADVSRIITAVFINQNGDRQDYIDIPMASDLTLNWILNVYDPGRTGYIQAISLKIGLSFLCSSKLQDKYRYVFRQLCSSKGIIDRKRLKLFLQESLQIPKYIFENAVFSGTSVDPAIKNCFETSCAVANQATLGEFLNWMIAEPQTIVWLPTLHRLAVSETVKHEAKCNVCKMYPIVGFRYRCLRCFNFDLCQECFWSGRVSKGHKLGHPTQEYCLAPSQKEDIKDFAKVMRNKVSKKKRKPKDPAKGRYISISHEDAPPSSDEEYSVDAPPREMKFSPNTHGKLGSYAARLADYEEMEESQPNDPEPKLRPSLDDEHHMIHHYSSGVTREPAELPIKTMELAPVQSVDQDQRDELEDLIANLENDNSALRDEIDHIHRLQLQSPEHRLDVLDDSNEAEQLWQRKERLLAREEVLEAHNRHLQIQLHRLRALLHQDENVLRDLILQEEKMTSVFVLARLKQIRDEATILEPNQTDGSSSSSQLQKSLPSTSQSKPYPATGTQLSTTVPHQPAPLSQATIIPNKSATLQSRGEPIVPQGLICVTQTAAAPTSSCPTLLPPESLGHGMEFRGMPTPGMGVPFPVMSSSREFMPPHGADMGKEYETRSPHEEAELEKIVERMTSSFPLDVESDLSMEIHSDLFLAAGMVGEAMQSMVTVVARQRGSGQAFLDSPGSYAQDITDDESPSHYSQYDQPGA